MIPSKHYDSLARLNRWWNERAPQAEFWPLLTAAVLFNFGVSVFFFLYNLYMLDLGYRERSLGLLASAMALGSMAGTIPMGIIARRIGVKKVLATCLLLMAAAFGARVFLFWYPAQITFAFFDGVMLCGWVICISPAVANVVEERRRPFAFSLLFAAAVATGSLGGFVGGNMPGWSQTIGMRFGGTAISSIQSKQITLLLACIATAFSAWPITRLTPGTRSPVVHWMQRPTVFLWKFLIASAWWAAVLGAFNPFTNVFFTRYLHVPTAHLGTFFSISQLLQAGAVLLMPLILRRVGLISGIMAAQLATAASIGLLAVGGSLLREEILYCAFMAAQHMSEPGMQSLLMDNIAPEERSGAAALNFLVISVSQAAASAAAGTALARFGYPPVLLLIGASTVGSAVGFRILFGSGPTSEHDLCPTEILTFRED